MKKVQIKTVLIALGLILTVALVVGGSIALRDSAAEVNRNGESEPSFISDEEVLTRMRQSYGEEVKLKEANGSEFIFSKRMKVPAEGELTFYAESDGETVRDNYYEELYRYTGDAYFAQTGRTQTWEEQGEGARKSYRPVFYMPGNNDDELRWFCDDVCDFLEYCYEVEPLKKDAHFTEGLIMARWLEQKEFQPTAIASHYDRTALYNELYLFADVFLLEESRKENSEIKDTQNLSDTQNTEAMEQVIADVGQDIIDLYLSYEPECTFGAADGMEYRMIAADRAAGSSYYVLLGTYDNGATCSFLNLDPYNGSGGAAQWLTFLDEKLGFSCLAYSGGAYGSLYRTEDGGKTFSNIVYPSAQILLSDGTYYNPFIMPEQIYEEAGKLCMVAGQGPNGDYYGEGGKRHALYTSEDMGITWEFSEEIE